MGAHTRSGPYVDEAWSGCHFIFNKERQNDINTEYFRPRIRAEKRMTLKEKKRVLRRPVLQYVNGRKVIRRHCSWALLLQGPRTTDKPATPNRSSGGNRHNCDRPLRGQIPVTLNVTQFAPMTRSTYAAERKMGGSLSPN